MQKSIAKRYATALFEIGLAKSPTSRVGLKQYVTYIAELDKALKEAPDFRTILVNPAVDIKKRHAIVREVGSSADWDKKFCNFVCLLIDRNRLNLVSDIRDVLVSKVDEASGVIRLKISSARPLGESEISTIVNALKRGQESPVEVETTIDPTLIGGVVAKIGEKVYDASIKTQLQKVRRSIVESV